MCARPRKTSSGPRYLVIVDQFLQLISMHHNVKATHLGQAELLPIHTGKANLEQEKGFSGHCVGRLAKQQYCPLFEVLDVDPTYLGEK